VALLAVSIALGIWLVAGVVHLRRPSPPSPVEAQLPPPVQRAGVPGQEVDAARLQALIEQGRLSDKEAVHYERVE